MKLEVERRLYNILKRCYPNLQKVLCLAFGVRYVYYTDSTLSIKIGEAKYVDINIDESKRKKAINKVKYFTQTDCIINWVKSPN